MRISDFDFNLPKELIATHPANPRDHSRLLVLDREDGNIEDKKFYNILDYLEAGDVLVLNNSKVIPARLIGKKESGGRVEVLLHKKLNSDKVSRVPLLTWQCMLGGRKIKEGLKIIFDKGLEATVLKNNEDGTWELGFNVLEEEFDKIIDKVGEVPLPPYISSKLKDEGEKLEVDDKESYQTVYAEEGKRGSVAAPTAGLHFTPELLEKIKEKGVEICYITLHVGMGTFAPVKVDNVKDHKMHSEYVEVEKEVIKKIDKVKKNGKRVVTVGTTSTRTLEAFFSTVIPGLSVELEGERSSEVRGSYSTKDTYSAWVNIFIYPGYKFRVVDAMITNFHLPKSTLIMLVSALSGQENIKKAYEHAIESKYRFYSYGDAMLIYNIG